MYVPQLLGYWQRHSEGHHVFHKRAHREWSRDPQFQQPHLGQRQRQQ